MTTTEHGAQTYPFSAAEGLALNPRYAELRRDEPLTRVTMPYGGEAWLATRYADIKTVLADARFSRAATVGADVPRGTPLVQQDSSILSMDPPEHTRLRRLVAKAFTARRIGGLRPRAQQVVDELVDTMIAAGPPADLAASLAWPLPITVICEMLGVPFEDRDRFRIWTDQLMALSTTDQQTILDAREQLNDYLAGLIARRRQQPTEDLLSVLVAARDEGDQLSETELVTFGVTLLVAGHETTANQTGNFMYTLLSQREHWDALVADPDLVPAAIEELLRYTPLGAGAGFPRIATEDIELGGRTVRAGDAVVVQIASANRDAAVFDEPDVLDFARPDNQHVAFGHGVHHCLGAQLARLELQIAIGTLARRLPGLRLAVPADEVVWKSNRLVRGVRELPVEW
ncbi:MAG TPA: cytochrome P450 [Pseudonocardiaceae bacterium]|jgi:cytochrome P450 RapN|nr:cytochrome P450 [Pseudonocardiaceae bacterium]